MTLGTASLHRTCVFPDASEAILQLTHLTDSLNFSSWTYKGEKGPAFLLSNSASQR